MGQTAQRMNVEVIVSYKSLRGAEAMTAPLCLGTTGGEDVTLSDRAKLYNESWWGWHSEASHVHVTSDDRWLTAVWMIGNDTWGMARRRR